MFVQPLGFPATDRPASRPLRTAGHVLPTFKKKLQIRRFQTSFAPSALITFDADADVV
jgi:hypothetical protein